MSWRRFFAGAGLSLVPASPVEPALDLACAVSFSEWISAMPSSAR